MKPKHETPSQNPQENSATPPSPEQLKLDSGVFTPEQVLAAINRHVAAKKPGATGNKLTELDDQLAPENKDLSSIITSIDTGGKKTRRNKPPRKATSLPTLDLLPINATPVEKATATVVGIFAALRPKTTPKTERAMPVFKKLFGKITKNSEKTSSAPTKPISQKNANNTPPATANTSHGADQNSGQSQEDVKLKKRLVPVDKLAQEVFPSRATWSNRAGYVDELLERIKQSKSPSESDIQRAKMDELDKRVLRIREESQNQSRNLVQPIANKPFNVTKTIKEVESLRNEITKIRTAYPYSANLEHPKSKVESIEHRNKVVSITKQIDEKLRILAYYAGDEYYDRDQAKALHEIEDERINLIAEANRLREKTAKEAEQKNNPIYKYPNYFDQAWLSQAVASVGRRFSDKLLSLDGLLDPAEYNQLKRDEVQKAIDEILGKNSDFRKEGIPEDLRVSLIEVLLKNIK